MGASKKMAYEYSETIEENILMHLEGWSTVEIEENYDTDTFLEDEELEGLNITKTISSSELELFWGNAVLLVESYLQRNLDELELDICSNSIQNGISMWAAGLAWRKYNIRVMDQVDETNSTGYGDELIIQAKAALKPYRYRKLSFIA